ncbi:MAG: hypothetical protein HAW67_04345 [Endozoicomonadaceae bacterium]|nr:hypothetical protein [Endozoicomonadaceae bacterium]
MKSNPLNSKSSVWFIFKLFVLAYSLKNPKQFIITLILVFITSGLLFLLSSVLGLEPFGLLKGYWMVIGLITVVCMIYERFGVEHNEKQH